jgi:hypothetical protein
MRRGVHDPDEDHTLKKQLAQRLDAEGILDYYGAENAYEQVNHDDRTREIVHSCLIDRVRPHHSNGDAHPSACCNVDHGLYVCYSYTDPETGKSGMDMITLVMLLEGARNVRDILPILNPHLSGTTQDGEHFRERLIALFDAAKRGPDRTVIRAYSDRVLASWAFIHPYLATRGISDASASVLQIGYDRNTNRITIPHFWGGKLVGWQQRAIPAGADEVGSWPATVPDWPKYKSSPGFPKGSTLYRYDQAQRGGRLVVVESPFSVLKAHSLGLQGYSVVATFGAKITDEQIALMRDFPEVLLWMDPDSAGYSAERKVRRELMRYTNVKVVVPEEGMDLGDYNDVEIVRGMLESATPARMRLMEEARNG